MAYKVSDAVGCAMVRGERGREEGPMALALAFLMIVVLAIMFVSLLPALMMGSVAVLAAGLWHAGLSAWWCAGISLAVYACFYSLWQARW